MQPERDNRGSVGVIVNAKDAAFFTQPVAVRIEAALPRWVQGRFERRPRHCLGAGANGAFLLIKASSFCLSMVEPLDPAVESGFFCG